MYDIFFSNNYRNYTIQINVLTPTEDEQVIR